MTSKKINVSDKKNKNLCKRCSACCNYIAVEIDKPTDNDDYNNILWFLLHKNVRVYIGWDNKWYLEFITPCKKLNLRGLCKDYAARPKVCREYSQKDCPKYSHDAAEKTYFKTADDFLAFLKKKKITLS